MRIDFEFYANLRDAVGEKTASHDVEDGATLADGLRAVTDEYEGLQSLLFRSDGTVRRNVTVAVNGDPILDSDPEDIELSGDDTVVLSPGVSGGVER